LQQDQQRQADAVVQGDPVGGVGQPVLGGRGNELDLGGVMGALPVPAGPASVGFSKRRFTEYRPDRMARPGQAGRPGEMILDFMVGDADAEFPRIEAFGVAWVLRPATQPWAGRSMVFKDPEGNLVNVFSRP
jgi:catechol 2,3-dioxygenase-like lactoylglutathione lyase family enzyme